MITVSCLLSEVLITILQEDDSVRGVELSGPDGAKLMVDCDACVMAQDKLLDADTFKVGVALQFVFLPLIQSLDVNHASLLACLVRAGMRA